MTTKTNSAPQDLVNFQNQLASFLRDPHHVKRPYTVPYRSGTVYGELLFHSVCDFLDSCFVICQKIISQSRWRRLCRVFYRDWQLTSPMFTDIPAEFTKFLAHNQHGQALPAWFAELAHYEWLELAVDIHPAVVHTSAGQLTNVALQQATEQALHERRLSLNPTLHHQRYRWPVHLIGPDYKTRKQEETFLLVYRDTEHNVRFLHTNAMTAALLDFIHKAAGSYTRSSYTSSSCTSDLLADFAQQIQYPDAAQLKSFALPLLADLTQKTILLISSNG